MARAAQEEMKNKRQDTNDIYNQDAGFVDAVNAGMNNDYSAVAQNTVSAAPFNDKSAASGPLLSVSGVEMKYTGAHALRGVNFSIGPGRIVGLLGPNGSGKTTLMKVIACLLTPAAGSVAYPGGAARGVSSKMSVAFLPDTLVFPDYMKTRDAFKYYSDMYPDYSEKRAAEMIRILDLGGAMGSRIKKLSKGMQERVAFGVTMSRETSVYLLDEPLGGVDPLGKSKIIDAILAMPLGGSSIVISTHLVKDMERIFDGVLFLSKGKIVFAGECDDMREVNGKTIEQAYLEVFANEEPV